MSTSATIAANNNNANGAVVPPSLTKEESMYVSAMVAFKGT